MTNRTFVDTPDRPAIDAAKGVLNAHLAAHDPRWISLYHPAMADPFSLIQPETARAIAWDLLNLADLAEHARGAP